MSEAEVFPIYNLSYEDLLKGYLVEANGLSTLLNSGQSNILLQRHRDYVNFIISRKKDKSIKKTLSKTLKSGRIVYSNIASPIFNDAFYSSHMSICCELFNNNTYTDKELEWSNLEYIIERNLSIYKGTDPSSFSSAGTVLHNLDAIRTIQILRVLTLITIDTRNIQQLSFGAGPGTKDIESIHSIPHIDYSSKSGSNYSLSFKMIREKAGNVIISDNDPQREEAYSSINKKNDPSVYALLYDTYETLEKMPALIGERGFELRNYYVALRIDHRMIPDVRLFFELLVRSMDQTADLIVTIGSGFTLEDFEGRINKLSEMYRFLGELGLKPVLIKLHKDGDSVAQRKNNSFSLSSITTYQILHCKLKRNILSKIIR